MFYLSILFIDSAVEHYQHLLVDLEPSIKVIFINRQEDGVQKITDTLAQNHRCRVVHIISHGSPGCLYLGNTQLSLATLDSYARALQSWFTPFGCDAVTPSLFLYGCSVAAGDAGDEFLNKLYCLTQASIAASTTLTGHRSLRGNWNLEYEIGQVENTLPIAHDVLVTYPGVLAVPTIIDTATLTRSLAEDTTLSITGLSVTDPDAGQIQTVTLAVTQGKLALASTNGLTGVTGNGTGNISFSGLVADVNAALNGMTYAANTNYNGNETLSIVVNDGTQSATQSVAIAVTPVNDAPTIAPTAAIVAEGGNTTFASSNFGIVDVDNQQVQIIVKINSLPAKGYLTFNGNRLVPGSTFSYDNAGLLVYHHDGTQTTALGGTADSFTVTVDDGAGGTIGITTIPITVAPVNQLPSITGIVTLFEADRSEFGV
jgi:hypothetical protein